MKFPYREYVAQFHSPRLILCPVPKPVFAFRDMKAAQCRNCKANMPMLAVRDSLRVMEDRAKKIGRVDPAHWARKYGPLCLRCLKYYVPAEKD
jgi:hypothetical protein